MIVLLLSELWGKNFLEKLHSGAAKWVFVGINPAQPNTNFNVTKIKNKLFQLLHPIDHHLTNLIFYHPQLKNNTNYKFWQPNLTVFP